MPMAGYPNYDPLNTPAFQTLRSHVLKRRSKGVGGPGEFEKHEKELHRLFAACEAETLAEDLARYDIDVKYITVDGERCRKAFRAPATYTSAAGSMQLERNLYLPVGGGRTVCPLELRSGIVEGAWTPHA